MKSDYFAVIMAGGGGTRLWPLSRKSKPKQALRLFGERTLFSVAVDRILPLIPTDQILTVTVEEQARLLRDQTPQLPGDNFILEPAPRGTASVIGLAAVLLERRAPGCVMACLTADHFISNEQRFRELLRAAYEAAKQDHLVTLGISPTHPDTGYGYIHQGELLEKSGAFEVYRVQQFKEKPEQAQAQAYLESGEYVWNSGMFVWKASRILEEIKRQMPELYEGLRRIQDAREAGDDKDVLPSVWGTLESQTIDFGIMEGAHDVVVIPADELGWLDVGGWGRLYELSNVDEQNNAVLAKRALTLDTEGTLLFQAGDVGQELLIATLGLEDMIVIDTGDVLLVCPRQRAEDVKRLVDLLDEAGLEAFL
jgi:mannose-1-phosphate guanylyltransferase